MLRFGLFQPYRMLYFEQTDSFVPDVKTGIFVTLMFCSAVRTTPIGHPFGCHIMVLNSTVMAELTGWIVAVYPYMFPAIPHGLIFQHGNKSIPSGISDPSGRNGIVLLEQLLYVQVFCTDDIVFTDQFRGQFLMEVFPYICYPLMESGYTDALLRMASAAL